MHCQNYEESHGVLCCLMESHGVLWELYLGIKSRWPFCTLMTQRRRVWTAGYKTTWYIGSGTGGQLPPQNIMCGGIASTIVHCHDSDTASPLHQIPYTHKLTPLQLDSVTSVQANQSRVSQHVTEIPVHECQVSLHCGPTPSSVGLYSTQHWKLGSLDSSTTPTAWHVDVYMNQSHTCEDVQIKMITVVGQKWRQKQSQSI